MKKRMHESVDYITHPNAKQQQWAAPQHAPVPMFPGVLPTDASTSEGATAGSTGGGPGAASEAVCVEPQMLTEQQVDAMLRQT
jgi:hypothetical protein